MGHQRIDRPGSSFDFGQDEPFAAPKSPDD